MAGTWETQVATIHESDGLLLGAVTLDPTHEAWASTCLSPGFPCVAFPRVPIATHAAGAQERVITPNSAMFANPDWSYVRRCLDDEGERSFVVAIDRRDLIELVSSINPEPYERWGTCFEFGDAPIRPKTHAASVALERLATYDGDPGALRESSVHLVEQSLRDMMSTDPRWDAVAQVERTSADHDERVRSAIELLVSKNGAPVSLSELGSSVHMSPTHFCRVFKRRTGFTVHAFQTQLRLRAVADSISRSPRAIARLAHEQGFSDQAHLTRACRTAIGLTPGAFRALLRDAPGARALLSELLRVPMRRNVQDP